MTELEKGPRGLRRGRGARERILSASQQLFRDQGINRTGMDQLCAVAQVSKRTLYQHFTGKDELIAEHLRRFDPDILPEVFDRTDLTPRERLLAAFDIHVAPVPVHRGGRRNPRPGPPGTRARPRLQEGLCRAAHRNRPRGRRHQPRTARRTTGAAPRWRLGPQPSPQHRHLRHRRRHRRRPHRQRHPLAISTASGWRISLPPVAAAWRFGADWEAAGRPPAALRPRPPDHVRGPAEAGVRTLSGRPPLAFEACTARARTAVALPSRTGAFGYDRARRPGLPSSLPSWSRGTPPIPD